MENFEESKLLIIDDDIFSLQLMQCILNKEGFHTIRTAENGKQGIDLILQELPDLVLLDYLLPDMDGFDVCKLLKENPVTQDIPVFIITGATVDYDTTMEDAFKTGASEYFTKPVRMTDFLPRMRTALKSKKLLDQVRREIMLREKAEEEQKKLIEELQCALDSIKALKGLLPICSSCKKIRDDDGYWQNVEKYIREHSEAQFTHGICPDCAQKLYPEVYEKCLHR
jgi:response regulator RpfG family c-di-GMP phosphodiesterase